MTIAERQTHQHDGVAVLFLLGIRVNRLRAVRSWLPAVTAMRGMLRELTADPSLGMLDFTGHISAPGALVVQYWRDLDALIKYSKYGAMLASRRQTTRGLLAVAS